MKGKRISEAAQPCPTLSDSVDCSLPGSSVHGIFQARELEWVSSAFSEQYAYTHVCVCMCMCVCVCACVCIGFPGGSVVKKLPANVGMAGFFHLAYFQGSML